MVKSMGENCYFKDKCYFVGTAVCEGCKGENYADKSCVGVNGMYRFYDSAGRVVDERYGDSVSAMNHAKSIQAHAYQLTGG